MMKKKRKISAFIVFACLVILIIESYNELPEFTTVLSSHTQRRTIQRDVIRKLML